MSKLPLIARIFLGLIFAGGGIMTLFELGPEPPALEGGAADFMDGLMGSGYFWTFLKISEIVAGIMLLTGIGVPLALLILAPIVANIVLFHLFLAPAPADMAAGVITLVLGLYLGYAYRGSFSGVLNFKAKPG